MMKWFDRIEFAYVAFRARLRGVRVIGPDEFEKMLGRKK